MTKNFCITIDTEPDCDVRWNRSSPLMFESVLRGVPKLLRPLWNDYQIHPVYFISPEVLDNADCCKVLRDEIKFGAEIGAHLHSEYIGPQRRFDKADGTGSNEFPCYAYSDEIEFEKIKNLTALIQTRLDVAPVSYRAARFGADTATIKSLQWLGYKVDSSVTPEINWSSIGGPDHSKAIKQPYFIDPEDIYSAGDGAVLEVPVTISGKRFPGLPDKWLFYRWLRPSHMTVFEMKKLVDRFVVNYDNPVLNMMFHSMELIPGKSPFVRSRIEQRLFLGRLKKVIQYLMSKEFCSRTLKEIYDAKLR